MELPIHDPLLVAGAVRCSTCGTRSYPADATWIDDHHLIAVYRPACAHTRETAWLVDPDALQPLPRQCDATTRSGTQCRLRPILGSQWCHIHHRRHAHRAPDGGC